MTWIKRLEEKDNDIRDDHNDRGGFDNDDMIFCGKEHMFKKHVQN